MKKDKCLCPYNWNELVRNEGVEFASIYASLCDFVSVLNRYLDSYNIKIDYEKELPF